MTNCACPCALYNVNGIEIAFDTRPFAARHAKVLAAACAAVLVALTLLVPSPAFGFDFVKSVAQVVGDGATAILNGAFSAINYINPNDLATAEFNNLMGSNTDFSVKTLAEDLCNNAVKPVAATFLSLVLLFQLLKISQRIDGNAAVPALKEVVMLYVVCAIAMWAVNMAFPLCSDLYDLIGQGFSNSIAKHAGHITINPVAGEITDLGTAFGIFIAAIVVFLAGLICAVAANFMLIARAIQIYLYAAFSPLMMAMFGLDETKQWALGYIKGFASASLSGVIIYFAVTAFPAIVSALMVGDGIARRGDYIYVAVTSGDATGWLIGVLAACIALFLLIVSSGKYAREILGG